MSIVGEEGGFDYDAYAELGVEFVVVEQPFAVTVVVLEEEVLVLVVAEFPGELEDCVVVEVPAAAFYKYDRCVPSLVVGDVGCADLIYAAVTEYVIVVFSVDDWDPDFTVDAEVGVDDDVCAESDTVPRS